MFQNTLIISFLLLSLGCAGPTDPLAVAGKISRGDSLTDMQLGADEYRQYLDARESAELQSLLGDLEKQRELVLDYHSENALARHATEIGLDEDPRVEQLIAKARRDILINALAEKIAAQFIYPSDETIEQLAQEHYIQFREKFRNPEKRRVAHILIKKLPECQCDSRTLEEKIEGVQQELAGGRDFAEVARAHSSDLATAVRGGELASPIQRNGKAIQAFEDVAFDLKAEGEISEPFATKFGTHIVKLLSIEAGDIPPFEAVRDDLIAQQRQKILNDEMSKVRADAYPKLDQIDLELLDKIIAKLINTRG